MKGQRQPRDDFNELLNGPLTEQEPLHRRATEPTLSTFDFPGESDNDRPPSDTVSQALSPTEDTQPLQKVSSNISSGNVDHGPALLQLDPVLEQAVAPTMSGNMHTFVPDVFQQDTGRLTPRSEKDSARLDVDEHSSQPRFYGPTSQRHLHRQSVSEAPEIDNVLSNLHNNAVNIDSGPVRSRLFQTFWTAQPLSQALVDQEMFEQGRSSGIRSQFYSAFLENIVLANATRMSTSPDIRALGPKFAEKATAQIVDELQDPAIATIQGFLLLSDFEATRGRDRLGYLYCGIGCRMIFDLGLQESCTELIAQGKLSHGEALYRHVLFVGAYVYDKLWSLYLGRPSAIPDTVLTVAQNRTAQQGWTVPATLDAWSGLSTDISEVTEILNGAGPLDWTSMERLTELDAKISRRCEALPPSLQLDENRISDLSANLYSIHIQFRGIRIILHRLLTQATPHSISHQTTSRDYNVDRSRAIMHESAVCIARLVSVYHQIFGIENVVTVMLDNMFVAAAMLVSHVLRLEQSDPMISTDADVQWIKCLADMLCSAQKHYPVTARMRSTLGAVVQDTSLSGMFGPWSRRSGPTQGDGGQTSLQPPGQFMADEQLAHPMMGAFHDPAFYHHPFADDYSHLLLDMDDNQNMMSRILSPLCESFQ